MYKINEKLLKEKSENPLSEDEKHRIVVSFKDLNDDDKILILISHIEGNQFKGIKEIIHRTFFELKENFQEHFKSFYFTKNDKYPFSKKIDDIFFRFQNYRSLSMKNPNYDTYLISDKTKEIIKNNLLPKIKDEEFYKDLPEMVKIIKKRLEF